MSAKPTELTITLAALPGYGTDYGREGWVYADQVRGRLALLGFDASAQQVAAWLRKMAAAESPWIEVRENLHFPIREYRVTRYGANDVGNRLPGVRLVTPWLPTMRGVA